MYIYILSLSLPISLSLSIYIYMYIHDNNKHRKVGGWTFLYARVCVDMELLYPFT